MSFSGFVFDMIRRNKEDRDNLKRLRKQRNDNSRLSGSSRLPDMSAEEFEKIRQQTKKRVQLEERYFIRTTIRLLIVVFAILLLLFGMLKIFSFDI